MKDVETKPSTQDTNSQPSPPDKKKQKKETEYNRRWVTWVLLVVIVILLILLLVKCSTGGFYEDGPGLQIVNPTQQTAPGLDDSQGDYVKPETPDVGGVAIPGWGKLTIPVNTSENIVVDFYNPEVNADKYYLTFELRIPSHNEQGYEVLYASGLISPGKHIQKINISRGLPAGTYNAILHVQPYRMSDKRMTNNADLKLELVVK